MHGFLECSNSNLSFVFEVQAIIQKHPRSYLEYYLHLKDLFPLNKFSGMIQNLLLMSDWVLTNFFKRQIGLFADVLYNSCS